MEPHGSLKTQNKVMEQHKHSTWTIQIIDAGWWVTCKIVVTVPVQIRNKDFEIGTWLELRISNVRLGLDICKKLFVSFLLNLHRS